MTGGPDSLRILFISGEYPPMQGGVADYTQALARALVESGHQVAVLTGKLATPPPSDVGIQVFPAVHSWRWSVWKQINAHIQAWQPHIVHIQYQTAAFGMHPAINLWAWRPWQRPSVATAVTFHDLLEPYLFPKAHPVRRWVTHSLARSVDLAITTNPEDSIRLRSVRPDAVEIPIGSNIPATTLPAHERASWRRHWGIPEQAPLICYFGFLNASKGGETLIDVLGHLVRAGVDAHLLMIGGRVGASDPTNYAYLQKVEARITDQHLEERVHWTDHIPAAQVSAAFHCADVCLLPYRDGVSYRRGSFMAALNHGMAIVTTPPAVTYPDLKHGETLLFAPADDIAALSAATHRALTDAELRAQLQAHTRQLARQFSWQAIAKRHLAAYRRLL